MKYPILAATTIWAVTLIASPALFAADIHKGDKLQALTNLHPDPAKRLLYTTNYQQAGLIPVCSEVIVKAIGGKKMDFEYQGITYRIEYEKHTKGAGISFQQAMQAFFGPACDQAKLKSLSQVDKDGVKAGAPRVGMSKEGVLFAMGRPPYHANPTLDGNYWLYWRNRFGKTGIEFDSKGKVLQIK